MTKYETGEKLTVKELIGMYPAPDLLIATNDRIGTTYYEDGYAFLATRNELVNKDNKAINMEYANKFQLDLMVDVGLVPPEDVMKICESADINITFKNAPSFSYCLNSKGRHYKISKRSVKSISDFSLCNVVIPQGFKKIDCACLVILSFAVLNEKVINCYGEISPAMFIRMLNINRNDE